MVFENPQSEERTNDKHARRKKCANEIENDADIVQEATSPFRTE
jgi:hypothetical protein